MSSELQLDVRHLNRWRRHLVNAYKVKAGMEFIAGKPCDLCLSALKWFVYHCKALYKCSLLYYHKHTYVFLLASSEPWAY